MDPKEPQGLQLSTVNDVSGESSMAEPKKVDVKGSGVAEDPGSLDAAAQHAAFTAPYSSPMPPGGMPYSPDMAQAAMYGPQGFGMQWPFWPPDPRTHYAAAAANYHYAQYMEMMKNMNALMATGAAGKGGSPDWGGGMGMSPFMGMFPPVDQNAGGASKKGGGSKSTKSRGERRRRGKGQATAQASAQEPPAVSTNPLLEELRKGNKPELKDALPYLIEFAQDQAGAKYVEENLEGSPKEIQEQIFEMLLPELPKLSSDACGKELVEKLFDKGDVEKKKRMIKQLESSVKTLATDLHGCRVLQKAIETVSAQLQDQIAEQLKNCVMKCVEDQHGNHVIQKCIEQMPPEKTQFVIDAFVEKDRVQRMAVHCFGCRVIQRLVEHCNDHQKGPMLDEILRHVPTLTEDQYGNYVIQHVLEHGRTDDKKAIIVCIRDNILTFAQKKCSSNVVEKCFEIASLADDAAYLQQERAGLMNVVLGEPGAVDPPLHHMMKDRFGNYIVQRMIEYSKGPERERLFEMLRGQVSELRRIPVGRHIIAALERHHGIEEGTIEEIEASLAAQSATGNTSEVAATPLTGPPPGPPAPMQ